MGSNGGQVPVPTLKEQIYTVTGILSNQQRLICRGKILKDDQLPSAYHVEDGHTLHLVVREPIPPSSVSFPGHRAGDQSNPSQPPVRNSSDGRNSGASSASATNRGGHPTPETLAQVMLSTRQFLGEQVRESLLQLIRQIDDHESVVNLVAHTGIQSNAMRIGALLQNLGAFLLELGRTTMTLQTGQSPVDAVVNAGPAVFISTSGPNPIMVQPLPFQPGVSFGAIPLGNGQSALGLSSSGLVGSGLLPRNINIRIRRGSVMPSSVVNSMEPTIGQPDSTGSSSENTIHQTTASATESLSSIRPSQVRVIPLRTVAAAMPATGGHATSNSSRDSLGLFYLVLARALHVNAENLNGTDRGQASDVPPPHDVYTARQSSLYDASQERNNGVPRGNGINDSLDQLLRTMLTDPQINDINFNGIGPVSDNGNVEAAPPASSQEAALGASNEGIFLSNLLRQIMAIVSQNTTETTNLSVEEADLIEDRNTQVSSVQAHQDTSDRGRTSCCRNNPSSPESSKRQKRE